MAENDYNTIINGCKTISHGNISKTSLFLRTRAGYAVADIMAKRDPFFAYKYNFIIIYTIDVRIHIFNMIYFPYTFTETSTAIDMYVSMFYL